MGVGGGGWVWVGLGGRVRDWRRTTSPLGPGTRKLMTGGGSR